MDKHYISTTKAGKDRYGDFAIEIVFDPTQKKDQMLLFVGYVVMDVRTGFIHYYTENPLRYSYCQQIVSFLTEEKRLTY